ncbi:MAG: DinB family protein [Candidatus Zixiibacteriota bacterium]
MYHTIDEFVQGWTYESSATQKQMDQLTDKSLGQCVVDGHRSLGRIAWHIATTIPEMMSHTGLKLTSVDFKAPVPRSASEIAKAYAALSLELLEQVKRNWNDASLQVEDNMYGEMWKRGNSLLILIKHEVHHRGQMTVLMRQAGLKVLGFYGPAKEEWVNYGAPAPEI